MYRPCFVVVDHEYPGSISSRKLVIETAKYNVITAYSVEEALQTLRRFPKVDGIVLGASFGIDDSRELIAELRKIDAKKPLVLTSVDINGDSLGADYVVPSFNPGLLLQTLQTLSGHTADSFQQHESSLDAE